MLTPGGRTLFAAKIKLQQWKHNSVDALKTCNCTAHRWRYVGFDIATVYLVLWPSVGFPHAVPLSVRLSVCLSGPLMSPRLLLTILCCLPQYSSELHMGHRGERQSLPFISTLIFLCDGWLSYCVICAFWKMLHGAEEITSLQIIQSSTVLWKKPGVEDTDDYLWHGLNYRRFKITFIALNKRNLNLNLKINLI